MQMGVLWHQRFVNDIKDAYGIKRHFKTDRIDGNT